MHISTHKDVLEGCVRFLISGKDSGLRILSVEGAISHICDAQVLDTHALLPLSPQATAHFCLQRKILGAFVPLQVQNLVD